ncbi:serine/threonine-protein kinase PknK [Haliangium sp.]|uniref:serine/threonine-protein kinase n=1 Tax=Haliangium sp. TaxID=2663208 RepID=UPI003D0DF1F4
MHPRPGLAPEASPRRAPLLIPGWSIRESLGAGGFGDVYRAVRASDGQVAALKVAHRTGDPRFRRELEALRAVNGPVVPALIGADLTHDGRPWIAMEYLPGRTLANWMSGPAGSGESTLSTALALLEHTADAVDQIHQCGIVHRDLKPDNLFICDGLPARVVVIDFGIATATRTNDLLTAPGQRLGTVLYAAPEQLVDAHRAGPAADLYALGVIAFQLLTGRLPFQGTVGEVAQGHATLRVPRASALAALPAAVDPVLRRAMAKVPAARYGDARSFVHALAYALSITSPSANSAAANVPRADPAPVPTPPVRPAVRRMAVLGTYARGDALSVAQSMAGEHGRVARVSGSRVLVAFDETATPAAGVRAAMAAARALPPPAHVVVHVLEVELRARGRRVRLLSPDLDNPEWMPPVEAWDDELSPVLLTAAAGRELSAPTNPATLPGYLRPAAQAPSTPSGMLATRGRGPVLAAITAAAETCLSSGHPGLYVITGHSGLGKSHLLDRVAESLSNTARVVRGRPTGKAPGLLHTLLSAAVGLDLVEPDLDRIRAACAKVVGEAVLERAWAELSVRLAPASTPDERRQNAPGAARFALAEVLATALRRAPDEAPLVLCIDDADQADEVVLDALELATIDDGERGPWVCLAAAPLLLARRPDLGRRSAHSERHELAPLDPAPARALLRDLLYPVERVPEEALQVIEQRADGIPRHLVEIVNGLRAAGAIRRRSGTGSWYLAADELLDQSPLPLAEHVASRELEALPAPLRAMAITLAALDDDFDAEVVDRVRASMEQLDLLDYGDVDTSVALTRLFCYGLLRERVLGRFQFRDELLRLGLQDVTPNETRRHLHEAIYRWLDSQPARSSDDLARLAHHASIAGHRRASARIWLSAAELDASMHEYARAERHFSAAVERLHEDDHSLLRALSGRARMRYRLEHWDAALADQQRAYALARAVGDDRARLDALLAKATILDWTYRWDEEVEVVQCATLLVTRLDDPHLTVGCLLARGRCMFRQEHHEQALRLLDQAARQAAELGDHELRVTALLLLPVSLINTGRADEAEACFEELVALCERSHDIHHLAVALGNRVILWEVLNRPERALADARRGAELARRIGHTTLEATADHNLAELLYYRGELEEALFHATRARDLYHRHADWPGPEHELLVTRIRVAQGDEAAVEQARAALRGCPHATWSESARLVFDVLTTPNHDRDRWSELVAWARSIGRGFPNEHLDVLCIAVRAALADGRSEDAAAWLAEARAVDAADYPPWPQRLDELAQAVGADAPAGR